MRFAFTIALCICALWALPQAAGAQDAVTSQRQAQIDAAAAAAQAEAAALSEREAAELRVDENMVEMSNLVEALAKNLGQMHFLRTLCFGNDDQKWRNVARDMMAVEIGEDANGRREFVRAFNDGFYQEKARYDTCSQSVSLDAAALAENGRHIASMLGDPYRER